MLTKNYLATYAKSFNWAGFFLPKKTYQKCSALYDFCREADNIADDPGKLEDKIIKFENFKKDFLNKNFVSIKVDREERPDVDSVYMTSVQIIAGHGGWPMSSFLTPKGKPFFAGTYFPKEEKYNLPSFKNLLLKISEYYNSNYENITSNKNSILNTFENIFQSSSNQELDIKEINKIFIDNLNRIFFKIFFDYFRYFFIS